MPKKRKTRAKKGKSSQSYGKVTEGYRSYSDLSRALFAAGHNKGDWVVLESAYYLVIPMNVFAENPEHYGECKVIEMFLGGKTNG